MDHYCVKVRVNFCLLCRFNYLPWKAWDNTIILFCTLFFLHTNLQLICLVSGFQAQTGYLCCHTVRFFPQKKHPKKSPISPLNILFRMLFHNWYFLLHVYNKTSFKKYHGEELNGTDWNWICKRHSNNVFLLTIYKLSFGTAWYNLFDTPCSELGDVKKTH